MAAAAAGCGRYETVVWRGIALGADASIKLTGPRTITERALAAAVDTLARMETLFSLYDPKSSLRALNRSGRLFMPPEFARLVKEIDRVHRLTGGLFDPTVQVYFHADRLSQPEDFSARVGWNEVQVVGNDIVFQQPGMAVTFNGIAQGFASDRVSEVLRSHGLEDVVVDAGEIRVGAMQASIGVSNASNVRLAELVLAEEAVATTSTDALYLPDGRSHVIAPNGDREIAEWKTVCVVAPTATLADGLSTALALAPNPDMAESLVRKGLASQMILEHRDGSIYRI